MPGTRRFGLSMSYLGAIVVLGITVVPLLFVVLGGLRTTAQINASPAGLPGPLVWDNYAAVLGSGSFWLFLGNSALIAVLATALAVGLGSMAGYALSRYTFKGREAFYTPEGRPWCVQRQCLELKLAAGARSSRPQRTKTGHFCPLHPTLSGCVML
jgi:ABC-type sugar transport system permease subunit